jgi:hypothetical protein
MFCFALLWQLFCGTADGRVKLWNPNNVAIGEISTDVDYPRYYSSTTNRSPIYSQSLSFRVRAKQ